MHEKDPVLDFLEQDPETDAEAFVQTKAKAKALAEAAKTAPAMATPAPTASTPEGEPYPGKRLIEKVLGVNIDAMTPPKGGRVAGTIGLNTSPETGIPESKVLDILTAASPYLPGGAAKTAIGKILSTILPTGAAAKEVFKPSSEGQKAEQGLGGMANAARSLGVSIPGLGPVAQGALAMGGEALGGSLLQQGIDKGDISAPETIGSTVLGLLTGGAGGIYPGGFRKNAVQEMEDLVAPGGKLANLNTVGLQKDYTPVTETAQRYSKSLSDIGAYEKSLADYSKVKAKFDAGQLKKKVKHESEQLAKQKAYEALAPHEKLTQAPPKLEPFVPDKAPVAPKAPGPQANIIRKQYRDAGFDDADLPFVERLAKNPDVELDKIFDDIFSTVKEEAPRTAANQTLNKVIKLFDSAKSKDLLKQKLGEHLFTSQINPRAVMPNDDPIESFMTAAKGGNSALEKILTKEEREAIIPAVDAVKAIAKAGKLGNFGVTTSNMGFLRAYLSPDLILELSPQRMANHVLTNAKNPKSWAATKAFASYIRGLKEASPLTGGRLTRATMETLEKGLLGLGARPVTGSEAAGKNPKASWSPFGR